MGKLKKQLKQSTKIQIVRDEEEASGAWDNKRLRTRRSIIVQADRIVNRTANGAHNVEQEKILAQEGLFHSFFCLTNQSRKCSIFSPIFI
jgi:hypothetical protein